MSSTHLNSPRANRITTTLAALKKSGKKALATYIVNGDPRPDVGLEAMHTLVKSGADIIELGVPFSDPMAEGPVIQRGHERALLHHCSLRDTLKLVSRFRETNQHTPVVLMGYANPIERMGYETCAQAAAEAGVDGFLTVDLPAEEAAEFNQMLKDRQIENIFLIAPTTTPARIAETVQLAGGFIYYVSLKGVTGAGHIDIGAVSERLNTLRAATDLPLLVGFGIKDAESAAAIGKVADGVVVGSVLVEAMGQAELSNAQICEKLSQIVAPMRAALDRLA